MKFSSWLWWGLALLLPLSIADSVNSTASDVRQSNAATQMPDLLNPPVELPHERGQQLYNAGRYAEAVAVWQQATSGDVLQQAQNLTFAARAYQALGEWDKARDALDRSLALVQNESKLDRAGLIVLGQTFSTQGSLYLAMGNAAAALESWQQAEEIYRQAEDKQGELGSQIDRAQALQALGLHQRAKTLLEEVARQLQTQVDTPLKAMGLRSLGTVWQVTGDLETAKTLLEKSLAISQQVGDTPNTIAATLFQLGNTTRILDADTALEYYDRAIAITTDPLTRIRARLNQLKLLTLAERWDRLSPLLEAIETEIDRLPPSRLAVNARINFAQSLISIQNSNFQLAGQIPTSQLPLLENQTIARILAKATQDARQLDDPRSESYAVGMMGQLYERSQQWQEARSLTETALLLAQGSQADEIAYLWQWQLGRIWRQQGDREATLPEYRERAIAAYTEAVITLGKLRNDVAIDPDLQVAFQEQIEPVYRETLELLLQSSPNGDPPSQTDLKKARQTFEALQLASLDNFFRQACLNVQPRQIDEIDSKAAVFHTILLQNRVAVILSLPGQPLRYYPTELPQAEIESVIDRARQSLNRVVPNAIREQLSQQIYDWIVRPAENELAEHHVETLVFVADSALQNLPFAALYDGDRYLIEKYAVANNSGLQMLDSHAQDRTLGRQLKLLGGGLTQARQGFSDLPGVELELEEIAKIVPTRVFLDRNFTESNLQTQVDRFPFPVVHLATHGNFGSTLEDTFILTWDEKINAKDLETLIATRDAQLRDPIELLVLSACQTASGDRQAVLGLAGVAVRSGARSTIASLWRVQDRSTASLMVAFYQALSQPGVSKAEALRQAQLQLLQDPQYKHPFFWGAFVLIGNWQ
jgi:CHAT domain-containing protein/tetratricopeptide (TPR) repeat protein